jgi:hypothetical protein
MPERMRSCSSSRSKSAMPAMIVAIMRPCGVDRSKAKPFIAMTGTRQYADRDIADALGRNTQLFPRMTFTQGPT